MSAEATRILRAQFLALTPKERVEFLLKLSESAS